jgi:hypothetical protein
LLNNLKLFNGLAEFLFVCVRLAKLLKPHAKLHEVLARLVLTESCAQSILRRACFCEHWVNNAVKFKFVCAKVIVVTEWPYSFSVPRHFKLQ